LLPGFFLLQTFFLLNMASSVCLLIVLMASFCAGERHSLFWNPTITPKLLDSAGLSKVVRIGDFLDIMCPHTGLTGTVKANATSMFNIYRVYDSDSFDSCRVTKKSKLFFSCDRPKQENKLTLKMQTFSPSPFGFKFEYCQTYYYIALPPNQATNRGCEKNMEKFKLTIACKETTTTTAAKTTTTTTIATTTETVKHTSTGASAADKSAATTTAATTARTPRVPAKRSRENPTVPVDSLNPKVHRVHNHAKAGINAEADKDQDKKDDKKAAAAAAAGKSQELKPQTSIGSGARTLSPASLAITLLTSLFFFVTSL